MLNTDFGKLINKSMNEKKEKRPDETLKGEIVDFLKIRDKKTNKDIIKTRGQ